MSPMRHVRRTAQVALVIGGLVMALPTLQAQAGQGSFEEAALSLPDGPEPRLTILESQEARVPDVSDPQPQATAPVVPARRLALTIRANQTAQRWTAKDKFEAGLAKEA